MNKRLLLGLATAGVAGIVVWLVYDHYHGSHQALPPAAGESLGTSTPSKAGEPPLDSQPRPTAGTAGLTGHPVLDLKSLPVSAEKRAAVASNVDEFSKQYGYAGVLDFDQAKALVQKREQARAAIVDQLAKLGPGGASAVAAGYLATNPSEPETIRNRSMLIGALGKINDEQAPSILQALLTQEDHFSLEKEIVAALGARQEADAVAALSQILLTATDSRLQMAAAQALSGRSAALDTLVAIIHSDSAPPEVRAESIHSVGLIGTEAAQQALTDVAMNADNLPLRTSAIQELSRSFGEKSLPTLQQLYSSPDENVRVSAVKGFARIHTPQAVALLEQATSDSSATVRQFAQAALASAKKAN
jgi:HEAT repeat protein